MCLYPKLLKNKKYTATQKNGGQVPPIQDERTRYIPVGCGNCMECRKQKARGWQVRLLEDINTNKNGKFVTLTFSHESIMTINEILMSETKPGNEVLSGYELDNAIATRATRLFLERWRKEHKKSLRHWLVTELGHNGTENIHLHGIVWANDLNKLEKIWQYGYVWKGKVINGRYQNYVNEQTIAYITKYVTKVDEIHTKYKSIILTSPGIGNNYTNTTESKKNSYKETKTEDTYRTRTGHKVAMPIYWRNKLYNDDEREKLWLQKLDKEERWILGNRVDISKGDEEYKEGLKYAQEKNRRLGYGDDSKDWKQEQYERERRMLMQKTRIEKAKRCESPPAGY